MKMLLSAAFATMLAACGTSAQSAPLLGSWAVTAVLDAAPVTAIDGAEANRLVGQQLVLSAADARFAGRTCPAKYESQQLTRDDFVREYTLDPAKTLKLPNPVRRVVAGCLDVLVRDPNTIVFTWEGFFLQAAKHPAP